jgi:hypothetical protein
MNIYLILIALSLIKQSLAVTSNNNVYRFEPIQIIEEPPIGTLIIDLASKLEINDLATSDYKFRFYSPHSLTAHYFLIDQLTGHVKTQRSLDREYLCETKACGPCTNTNNCTLPIEIVAQQTNSFKQQKFVSFDVIIEDKNEFAPKFPRESIVLNISENAPVNFTVPIDAAIDRDSKQSKIIYKLMPISANDLNDNNMDEIEALNSRIHLSLANNPQQQLSLTILKPFDYENEKELNFKILASDLTTTTTNTEQVLTGVCYITIKIIDLNDNIPQFDKQEYEYRLDEDKAQPGTKLIRVHATDKDDGGLNGLVKYYFVDQSVSLTNPAAQQNSLLPPQQQQQTTNSIRNIFHLDEISGWISVSPNWSSGLDYEQAPVYRLTVRAQDSGISNSIPVYATVTIYLNDVNDNSPQISLTVPSTLDDFTLNGQQQQQQQPATITPVNQLEISEWTPVEQFLAQIVINDLDSGLNGKLRIEMSQTKKKTGQNIWMPADDFVLVHLFNNIYSLMTKQTLNRELFDLYALNITVTDSGQPLSLSTVHKLLIKIKDENDNSPIFTQIDSDSSSSTKTDKNGTVITYEFYQFESNDTIKDNWIVIGRVKAIDQDINENALITYELDGAYNVTSLFKIDSETGLIRAKSSAIDRELTESYELKVIATDTLNKAVANLIIKIKDVNDNRPVFEHHTYKFKIKESDPPLTRFGNVKAFDSDKLGTNYSTIKYSIIEDESSNKIKSLFRINEITGDLYLQSELDYEKVTSYEFKVIATDGGQLASVPCLINIEVIDINDNRPQLLTPTDLSMPLIFSIENLTNKPYLFTVNATDLDKSNVIFGRLRYILEDEIQINNSPGVATISSETTDLFECDLATGQIKLKFNDYDLNELLGVYALVIKISDFGGLTTNAYVFLALTNKTQLNDTNYMQRINRLRQLVNEANLNENNNENTELKFRRLVKYLNSPTDYSDYYINQKNSEQQQTNQLTILKNQIIQAFNGKNYKLFLIFIVVAAIMIVFILISLAMSVCFYRKYNDNGNKKNSKEMNKNLKKSSLNSPTAYGVILNNVGSASPSSSITSSELIDASNFLNTSATNSDEPIDKKHNTILKNSANSSKVKRVNIYSKKSDYFYDDEEEDDEDGFGHIKKMATLKTESSNGMSTKSPSQQSSTASLIRINRFKKSGKNQKTRLNKPNNQTLTNKVATNENSGLLSKQIYDSNLNTSGEVDEQRSILMLNTNSPTATSSSSSSGIISSSLSSAQQLLVLAPSTSSSSNSNSSNRHKMVASTESLASLNESQTNAANNKTVTSINQQPVTYSSSRSSTTSQELSSSNQQNNSKLNDLNSTNNSSSPNSFRTFKINYSSPNRQQQQQQQSVIAQNNYRTMPSKPLNNNYDLKPLNLPVNELFKRYELKKQGEFVNYNLTSTCSNSSLNSIPHINNNNQRKIVEINIKNINKMSPHLVQKQLMQNQEETAAQVPDYFFKDEKEYKKFLASQTNKLNCKHIIETTESTNKL